jgi:site-specific DNA-methyltransferase (adenine-specific)
LSKTIAPTAQQFKAEVDKFNDVIKMATEYAQKLSGWSTHFIQELARSKAKTKADVQACHNAIVRMQAQEARDKEDEARRQASAAEQKRLELERQEEQARQQTIILSKLVLGDSREQIANAPDGIKLLLTDPPYGKDFQSNRRIIQKQAPKLANDDAAAFDLLRDVLTAAYPKMAADSFALVWTDWKFYCEFKAIVEDCGFEVRTVIVWNKPNHGSGDLEGTPAPKHEWCIFAVKGNPKLNFRFDNVLTGNQFLGTDHPTEKPLDLLETLIKATTNEGDLVVDPFFGGGSTPVTAYKLNRDFWACEIDANWHSQATERIFNVLSK